MKKRGLLVFLLVILSVNVVTASYGCSNGSITIKMDTLNIGEVEYINGINVGLASSSVIGMVDLLIDAKSISLTNNSPSVEVGLISGNYDISLINITDDLVTLDVEGDEEEIEEGDVYCIDDLDVYMFNVEGEYPGEDAKVELLVGIKHLFLHSSNLASINNVEGIEYLFEFSSSESYAIIKVGKCEEGDIIEINDTEDNGITNITDQNTTENETDDNITIQGQNETDDNQTAGDGDSEEDKGASYWKYALIGCIILIIAAIILFLLKRVSKEQETTS